MVEIDKSIKKKISILICKIVTAFFFLLIVVHQVNFSELEAVLKRVGILPILYGGILAFLAFSVEVIRNHVLFQPYSKKIKQIFAYRMAAMSLNNLLPSSLSGELYIVLMYGKDQMRKLMVRNFFMLFVNFLLILILSLGVAIQNEQFVRIFSKIDYVFWGGLIISGAVFVLIALFCFKRMKRVSNFYNFLLAELQEIKITTFLFLVFLTLVNIFLQVLRFYILLFPFDIALDISLLIIFIFFLNLAFLLPGILGGIGVVEASAVGVLVFLGVAAEEAFIVALINRLYIILFGISGLYFLVQNKRQSRVHD